VSAPSSRARLPLIAALACVVVWSTTYAVSVAVLHGASPAVLSVVRFAVAGAALLPFAMRRPGFRRSLLAPRTIVLAVCGIALYYAFTNIGLSWTTAGSGALSAAMTPVMTTAFALLLLRERPSLRTGLGLVLTTAGVVVVGGAGLRLDAGLVLCLVGLAAYALYVVLLRRSTPDVDAVVLGTTTTIWGAVMMAPWLAIEAGAGILHWPSSPVVWGGILYEGLLVTAPTMILFSYAAERLPAAISGISIAGIPVLGYLVALLFGEPWDAVKALGGLVALAGIVVATVPRRTRAAVTPLPVAPLPEPEPFTDPDADLDPELRDAA
jgi:drug/metabolite transporter (DMT)-like permease